MLNQKLPGRGFNPDIVDDPAIQIERPPRSYRDEATWTTEKLPFWMRSENQSHRKRGRGITQHIGAYQVEVNGKKLLSSIPRAMKLLLLCAPEGSVTDIAVLVVAADDGVMPQTIEAINHAWPPRCRLLWRLIRSTNRKPIRNGLNSN